ncbi:MAG: hypothetical protein L3J59_13575 [Methylococcaceae bacterium]|nr:hypothetical protein [Methylococcaceae bacterium]
MLIKNCVSLSLLCLSSCASIVSQSEYPVTINSSPEGATFVIKNQAGQEVETGVTPKQVTLTTKAGFFDGETYAVRFDKLGYKSEFAVLDTHLDDWFFGNILFGATMGSFIIDPLTGAMWELPEESSVSLVPE